MFNYMCIYTSLLQEHVITSSIHTFNLYTKFLYLEQQITDTTKDVGA